MLELLAAATMTALATGLGAIPVFVLDEPSAGFRGFLLGSAAGAMVVAALVGLLLPGIAEGGSLPTLVGAGAGVLFMFAVRSRLERSTTISSRQGRASALVFAVLLVHSLPEGLAIGTAYASGTAELGAFVVVAIALQNIPEGTSIAMPMAAGGASATAQVGAAIASSLPQPAGALAAYAAVDAAESLLPFGFGFAAGAMLAVVVVQTWPDARKLSTRSAAAGAGAGAALMLALDLALDVPV